MQLALLVQVHDMLQYATISAVGHVDFITKLKTNVEFEIRQLERFNTVRTGLLETPAPENAHIIYPTVHVIIADQHKINNVVQRFQQNQPYTEVYDLVQNLVLIENY